MTVENQSENRIISPRKLIEVALPLDAINKACAYEKMPGIGAHPRGIHHWWARRPLAAARAVIFAQLVNDPAGLWEAKNPGQTPSSQQRSAFTKRRKELFILIEDLVQWKNSNNEEIVLRARNEIQRSWKEVCELNKGHPRAAELFDPAKLPGLHDPFAGGGAIPLEAQRLGLEAWASDLNPVAVLINKAMVEIPPKFAGKPPIGPIPRDEIPHTKAVDSWSGISGLAEDVRRYGNWLREEALSRVGHLYPKIKITAEMSEKRPDLKPLVDQELTVIAWLWARTVKSPNPAFSHADVPLVSSFILSNKEGKEAWLEPVVEGDSYRFTVRVGTPLPSSGNGTKASGGGGNFVCVLSNTPITGDYIKAEGKAGRMSARMMAIVAEGHNGRIYLAPDGFHENIARTANPEWFPSGEVPSRLTGGTCVPYGLKEWGNLFTCRQLVALNTFSDLIAEVRQKVLADAIAADTLPSADDRSLEMGGAGPLAYSDSICLFLAFGIDRCADFSNTATRWVAGNQKVMNLFAKQAIGMTWDFPEANILVDSVGGFTTIIEYITSCLLKIKPTSVGFVRQADAQTQELTSQKFVSTDPPYYANIAYADLSDFFYVWLRKNLKCIFPGLLATISVPKKEELIAAPHRQGSKEKAEKFFLNGMTLAIRQLVKEAHPEAPITIYYAFKQSDSDKKKETSSAGWETFLSAVIDAGLQLTGTWPLRSEQEYRMIGSGTNALASSIVLVCRKRPDTAVTISRREFQRQLNSALPAALDEMTRGAGDDRSPVAPVDLSQAIIGPGMAIFSKYAAVLEADGSPMSVKTALQLINRFLAEDDFDSDTQFCLHWFEQNGWREGLFGEADVLARAKSTSVEGLNNAGVLFGGGGKVRLRRWNEYPTDWDPATDSRLPVWEALHQLIRALRQQGESASGALLAGLGGKVDAVRQLAYRLYTLCERQGQAEDARAYNELITSWSGIEASAVVAPRKPTTGSLFD